MPDDREAFAEPARRRASGALRVTRARAAASGDGVDDAGGPRGGAFVAAVFVLSGFAALVYQVVWQRALLTIYGVNAESVTVVVTAFMLGLGLGSLVGGWMADRARVDLLRVFAAIEGAVCAYGIGSLALFAHVGEITGPSGPGAVFVATFALVLLPTALMGATLPLLVAHATRRSGNVGRSLAVLYFANTLGGAVAAVVTAVVLLRYFGLQASVLVAAAANALVAVLVLAVRRSGPGASRRERGTREDGAAASPRRLAWAMGCAALVGFVSLSWEILWLRIYAFATGGTVALFGLFLGIYLLGIAFGSLLARHSCAAGTAGGPNKIAGTAGLVASAAGATAFLHSPTAAWVAGYGPPVIGMAVAAGAGMMYGTILPLVTHGAVPADGRTGRRVAYVYLANIVGSSLGAALTGFVLLDRVGMAASSTVLLGLSAALVAMLLCGTGSRRLPRSLAAVAVATLLLVVAGPSLYGSLYERLLWKMPSAQAHRFADLVETRAGVVAVTADGTVFGSGAYDGRLNTGLDDDRNMIYRAYGLGALHPAPRRVLMIGLGSGSWAQVVAHLPGVEELVVVEINAGYLEIVRRYGTVASLLTNPKVDIVVDDGRRWLGRAADGRFDAIVANVTFHWRMNTTHLLSREFFELAASRLTPDGVLYFNATHSDEAMRTACTSFFSGLRFGSFVAVANREVRFDVEAFERTVRTAVVDGRRPVRQPDVWLADNLGRLLDPDHLESCSRILARTPGVRLITDDNLAGEAAAPWYAYYAPNPGQ